MNEVGYEFRQFYIPARMMGGLQQYIQKGIPPGGFLTAVLSNDLSEAVSRADDENMMNLPAYVAFLCNEAPSLCYGSREKMKVWIESFDARRVKIK